MKSGRRFALLLLSVLFAITASAPAAAYASATVCQVANGCTGTGSAPSYGQLLVGNSSGGYSLTATSSLGVAAASTTLLGDNNTFSGSDTFSQTVSASVSGNANTATTLQTSRTINGVSFNGSA